MLLDAIHVLVWCVLVGLGMWLCVFCCSRWDIVLAKGCNLFCFFVHFVGFEICYCGQGLQCQCCFVVMV